MKPAYECDMCGACCRMLIIEVEHLDVLREPKIRDVVPPFKVHEGMVIEDCEGNVLDPADDPYYAGAALLVEKNGHYQCPFVQDDNKCAVYASRPNCCVAFQAGSQQCQEVRESAGLPRLEPTRRMKLEVL
jgi:Fe-S-cluster containining protein